MGDSISAAGNLPASQAQEDRKPQFASVLTQPRDDLHQDTALPSQALGVYIKHDTAVVAIIGAHLRVADVSPPDRGARSWGPTRRYRASIVQRSLAAPVIFRDVP